MTAFGKVTSVCELIKVTLVWELSLLDAALMPAALGLQAQSITYWIRPWDKYCKMRYGKKNGV